MAAKTPLTHTPALLHTGTVGSVPGLRLVLFLCQSNWIKVGMREKVTATAAREISQAPTILSQSNTCQESACQSRLNPRLPDPADPDVIV